MGFQKEVNLYPAAGVPGQQAGLNPMAHLIPVPVAGADGVVTGNAVWYDTQPGRMPGRARRSASRSACSPASSRHPKKRP